MVTAMPSWVRKNRVCSSCRGPKVFYGALVSAVRFLGAELAFVYESVLIPVIAAKRGQRMFVDCLRWGIVPLSYRVGRALGGAN